MSFEIDDPMDDWQVTRIADQKREIEILVEALINIADVTKSAWSISGNRAYKISL
jgi:hypothetical protein